MFIERLVVSNVRNIKELTVDFYNSLNIFCGLNGSGKTSLLEAIYLLHAAKSFRSNQIQPIIQHQQEHCTVYAKCRGDLTLGLQKSSKQTLIRKNGNALFSASELASTLPVVLIYQDLFSIIDQGPSIRRKLLDWGVFHVEPTFKFHWKSYQRALKQRNNALKKGIDSESITGWDMVLNEAGGELSRLRERYLVELNEISQPLLARFKLPEVKLSYDKGWKGDSLLEVLKRNIKTDRRFKTTTEGPHRADLLFSHQNYSLKQAFSRGQKKLFVCILKFAQAELLERNCLFLLDDLSSELDCNAKSSVMNYLQEANSQIIVTALNEKEYDSWTNATIHPLENGMLVK